MKLDHVEILKYDFIIQQDYDINLEPSIKCLKLNLPESEFYSYLKVVGTKKLIDIVFQRDIFCCIKQIKKTYYLTYQLRYQNTDHAALAKAYEIDQEFYNYLKLLLL